MGPLIKPKKYFFFNNCNAIEKHFVKYLFDLSVISSKALLNLYLTSIIFIFLYQFVLN